MTSMIALAYSTSAPPSSCNFSNSTLVQTYGTSIKLSWPQAGQCGFYRVCTWKPECVNDYSSGVAFNICVDAVGQPSCTFMP